MKAIKGVAVLLTVLGLSIALVGTAWAHFPAGTLYYVVQFPDELIPTIDGDLSDWDIVPDAYVVAMDDMFELVATGGKQGVESEAYDLSDFNVVSIVGWNENANRLYTRVSIFDDIHQRDNPEPGRLVGDDTFDIIIDADHAGDAGCPGCEGASDEEKKRLQASRYQFYLISAPPVGGVNIVSTNAATWDFVQRGSNEFFALDWSFEGDEFGESTYRYEVMTTPFDDKDWHGPETSIIHDLKEGEIIGYGIITADLDLLDSYDAYWTIGGPCCDADNFADFLLAPIDPLLLEAAEAPTAVEPNSWGRIKSTFER